jgi:transposase
MSTHSRLNRLLSRPPPGLPRQRVADRIIFDKLVQVLVFGCGYRKIADQACSATTIRDRRDQWITAGIFATLELLVLQAYDQMIGLEFGDLAVDGCITKAPCGGDAAGRSPVDRGKQGRKRSTVTEARGIPLGTVAAAANRNDSPLLGSHPGHHGTPWVATPAAYGPSGPRL